MSQGEPMQSTGSGHIEAENVVVKYGGVTAVRGVSLAIEAGRQLTLLGPSGCGKTTMLRAIAGLEQPASGEIRIGGNPVFSSAKRINVAAEKRGMSMVFQSYAIWPHMTVFENVAYGLRVRKRPGPEIAERVKSALDLVQMGQFAERKASQLSGGQQQRVALARAFVFQPSVLLFDEPLSNLDAKLRGDMRIELRELQSRLGITSLYVTHDLEEALAMSDRIVVMRDGLIEQQGTPDEIYNRPRSAFVADFIGSSNLVTGRHRPDLAREGGVALETPGGIVVHGMRHGRPLADQITMSLRTTHLRLTPDQPPRDVNVWPVRVRRLVFQGDFTQALVELGSQTLIVRATSLEGLSEGSNAWLEAEQRRCVLLEG